MSYLLRWVRQNQVLVGRSASLLANQQGTSVVANALISNQAIKPLYQIPSAPLTTTTAFNKNSHEQAKRPNDQPKDGVKDDIEYKIRFKELDVKKIFKDFYSIYGPLFVACHIGIGLCSLGFFCSLVHFAIDPTAILPDFLVMKLGERISNMTGTGGKFVAAYAIHKLILPIRLFVAIWLTRSLSRIIQARRAVKLKK